MPSSPRSLNPRSHLGCHGVVIIETILFLICKGDMLMFSKTSKFKRFLNDNKKYSVFSTVLPSCLSSCLSTWKCLCSDRRKNHGCGQKKQEGTSSAIFGDETAAKCSKLKPVCRLSSQQNRQQRWSPITRKFELLAWTFSPRFFRLNWTFRLPPKRQLRILLNF